MGHPSPNDRSFSDLGPPGVSMYPGSSFDGIPRPRRRNTPARDALCRLLHVDRRVRGANVLERHSWLSAGEDERV